MASRVVIVEMVGDTRQLERAYRKAAGDTKKLERSMTQSFRGVLAGSGAFRSVGRQIAFASSAFLGGAGLVATMKASVDAASSLNEQISKTNVVFDESARSVIKWSRDALGLAQDQALETASSFGALFQPLGIAGEEAAKQSVKLTQLGVDLASFYNTSVQDALDAIRSGLVGESEPLRKYGTLLSETRVQQEAMTETGKDNAKQLTDQEKVIARINLIYKDTAQAQGDYARTSGGLANQQRELAKNVRNLQIQVGRQLLPDVLKIVKAMNAWVSQSKNQKQITDTLRQAVSVTHDVFIAFRGVMQTLNEITGSTKNTLKLLFAALVLFKTANFVSTLSNIAGNISTIGTNAKTSTGQVKGLNTALGGLTASAWVVTLVIAEQTIRDPGVIRRRADYLRKLIAGGGARGNAIADAIGSLPTVGPLANALRPLLRATLPQGPEIAPSTRSGQDTSDMRPGRSPAGAAPFLAPGTSTGGRGQRPWRASFNYQMSLLNFQLAQSELTATKVDDRAVLVRMTALLKRKIAITRDLKLRTDFTRDLKSVQDQINQIDQDAAQKEKDQRDKELALQKRRLDAHREHVRKLRAVWQEHLQKLRDAAEQVRSEIGLPTFQSAPTGILGVPAPSAGGWVRSYAAQTRQFVKWNNDLTRLVRRGAPSRLVAQLQGMGPEAAGLVHSLAYGPKATLNQLVRSYQQRERVVQQIAKADINARHVTINVAGSRIGASSTSQRRGQTAGIPNSLAQNLGLA